MLRYFYLLHEQNNIHNVIEQKIYMSLMFIKQDTTKPLIDKYFN